MRAPIAYFISAMRCSKMGYQASSIRVYCLRLENEIAIGLRIQIQRQFFYIFRSRLLPMPFKR